MKRNFAAVPPPGKNSSDYHLEKPLLPPLELRVLRMLLP